MLLGGVWSVKRVGLDSIKYWGRRNKNSPESVPPSVSVSIPPWLCFRLFLAFCFSDRILRERRLVHCGRIQCSLQLTLQGWQPCWAGPCLARRKRDCRPAYRYSTVTGWHGLPHRVRTDYTVQVLGDGNDESGGRCKDACPEVLAPKYGVPPVDFPHVTWSAYLTQFGLPCFTTQNYISIPTRGVDEGPRFRPLLRERPPPKRIRSTRACRGRVENHRHGCYSAPERSLTRLKRAPRTNLSLIRTVYVHDLQVR